jgi:hypothetical protein
MKKAIVPALTAVLAFAAIPQARAQQPPEQRTWLQERVPAPSKAFEVTVGTGYTQGLGMLRGATSLPDVATPGIGFDLGAGYRVNERLSLGLVGQYHELNPEQTISGARGLTAGVALTYHIAPQVRFDPWVEVGTGYRALWLDQPGATPNVFTHGLQLARARIGADFRVSQDVALGPVIGADVNTFLWQDAGNSTAIDDVRVNTFVFAGIQGRMDIGGTRVGTTRLTSAQARR